MIKASIILPTFNRCFYLEKTLTALINQEAPANEYEILVCDNASTDKTKEIVLEKQKQNPHINLRYLYEPIPGSLSARHCGYRKSNTDNILIFIDDDVLPVNNWLSAIIYTFNTNRDVHMLGGPSIPIYEAPRPQWIEYFSTKKDITECCPDLSLLQIQTDNIFEVDPVMIMSLNMSIRKKTFKECGGLHLCVMPKEYQHFQGDGETGLSIKLKDKGYKAFYNPNIEVKHIIPKERLTFNYFDNRYFYQGVCNSYTDIRTKYRLYKSTLNNLSLYRKARHFAGNVKRGIFQEKILEEKYQEMLLRQRFHQCYLAGYNFHQWAVKNNNKLLSWVLKENYFDYKLPDIFND
jgi:glycosyltransferase involved in cell wall biosynthesis